MTKEEQEIFTQATEINRLNRELKDSHEINLRLKNKIYQMLNIAESAGLSRKYLGDQGFYEI